MTIVIWERSDIILWTQLLLDSYQKLLGSSLIDRKGTPQEQTKALFFAPFVVVSHGTEASPIFNYGNQTALNLWEISWQDFIQTPSRQAVEGDSLKIEQRERMLRQVREKGYIDDYQGIRISQTGKRFYIAQAIVWNLIDSQGNYCGQAATFAHWKFLESI